MAYPPIKQNRTITHSNTSGFDIDLYVTYGARPDLPHPPGPAKITTIPNGETFVFNILNLYTFTCNFTVLLKDQQFPGDSAGMTLTEFAFNAPWIAKDGTVTNFTDNFDISTVSPGLPPDWDNPNPPPTPPSVRDQAIILSQNSGNGFTLQQSYNYNFGVTIVPPNVGAGTTITCKNINGTNDNIASSCSISFPSDTNYPQQQTIPCYEDVAGNYFINWHGPVANIYWNGSSSSFPQELTPNEPIPIPPNPSSSRTITHYNKTGMTLDLYYTDINGNTTKITTLNIGSKYIYYIPLYHIISRKFTCLPHGEDVPDNNAGPTRAKFILNQPMLDNSSLFDTFSISTVPPGLDGQAQNGPRSKAVKISQSTGLYTKQQSYGYNFGIKIIPNAISGKIVKCTARDGNALQAQTYPNDTSYPKEQNILSSLNYDVEWILPYVPLFPPSNPKKYLCCQE